MLDRCYRAPLYPPGALPPVVSRRGQETPPPPPRLVVQLYLNGRLTSGTRVFRDEGGMKYSVRAEAFVCLIAFGAAIKKMPEKGLEGYEETGWMV